MAVGRAQGIGSSNHLFHGWFLIIDVLLWGHAVLAVECDQHTALRKIHEKNFDCDVLIGRIVWSDAMQKVLEKVKIIKGTLHYHHTDTTKLEIANLEFIGDQSEPFITIQGNHQLRNIRSLLTMKFEGKEDHSFVTFLDNPAICDTYPMRDQIMEKVQAEIFFNNECLTSCTGGKVDKKYLSKFPEYCSTIGGDLIIVERDGVDDLTKLEQITTIWGTLIIANNTNIPDLKFLRYLRHIGEHALHGPALVLANNSGLTELSLERLESLQAATDVPHLVDVKLVEGQYITDMNILIRPSGNRVQISHVNDIRKMAENHENNIWLAFLVVGCGCLVLVLLGVIAFVLFARKDKNKVTRTQETRSLPSLSTPSKTVQSGTQ